MFLRKTFSGNSNTILKWLVSLHILLLILFFTSRLLTAKKDQETPCKDTPPRNCFTKMDPSCAAASPKYRSFDGSCNNLLVPSRGKSGTTYRRFLRPEYEDG